MRRPWTPSTIRSKLRSTVGKYSATQYQTFQTPRARERRAELKSAPVRCHGRFQLRALRAQWRLAEDAPARRVLARKANAAPKNSLVVGRGLIDWTIRRVKELIVERRDLNADHDDASRPIPGLIEAIDGIISSSPAPAQISNTPSIGRKPETASSVTQLKDRSLIASDNLQMAITEAVKKSVPGCEALVGVIVQRTTPKSRFDANWDLRGVKFGRADRQKADKALSIIVERMQREFRLSDD